MSLKSKWIEHSASNSLHKQMEPMRDQQVYKQVTKPPVKITYTYMERKMCITSNFHTTDVSQFLLV